MKSTEGKLAKPTIKDSRVLTYLSMEPVKNPYVNTEEEAELVMLWDSKFKIAKEEYEKSRVNSTKVATWRSAYLGNFKQLDEFGHLTDVDMKALRKLAYELVEQKVNPRIPAPKMSPRYYSDLIPV